MLRNCCCGGTPTLPCTPCAIPKKTLTVSWVNSLTGNGSTTMTFSAPNSWSSGCSNQLLYGLTCIAGMVQFTITFFISGVCPSGQSQTCQYPGAPPSGVRLIDSTCSPFHMHFQMSGVDCPTLSASGYTDFYIDE